MTSIDAASSQVFESEISATLDSLRPVEAVVRAAITKTQGGFRNPTYKRDFRAFLLPVWP